MIVEQEESWLTRSAIIWFLKSRKRRRLKDFKTLKEWWLLMVKPDLYGRQRSNALQYTPLVVGGGPPQC